MATISAGNEELIGNLIAEALAAVGADGVLSIETGNSLETTVEVQEGMLIDRGYISPQFVTNNVCSPANQSSIAGSVNCAYMQASRWIAAAHCRTAPSGQMLKHARSHTGLA